MTTPIGYHPTRAVVLGGWQIYRHGHRTASLVDANKVSRVAKALAEVDKAWMRERFLGLPDTQFHEISDEMFEWVWGHFVDLPPFFASAGAASTAVICTISH